MNSQSNQIMARLIDMGQRVCYARVTRLVKTNSRCLGKICLALLLFMGCWLLVLYAWQRTARLAVEIGKRRRVADAIYGV